MNSFPLFGQRDSDDVITKWLYRLSLTANSLQGQYGEWASTSTDTLTQDVPTPLAWNVGISSSGALPSSGGTYLLATATGSYAVVCSVVFSKGSGGSSSAACYAWIETSGGVQIGNSGRHVDIPTGETNEISLNQIIPLNAGQEVRIMVAANTTSVTFTTLAAQTVPYARPQVPCGSLFILRVN